MIITTAAAEDVAKIKEIWVDVFGDSKEFADFAVNIGAVEEIYLIKEKDEIAAMLTAGIDVFADGEKGFYIYGLATVPQYRGKGFAKQLVQYVCDKKLSEGYKFAITQPAQESLFDFYRSLGFDGTTYLRKCTVNVKRNLWATAAFDAVTASRFKQTRDKYADDTVVHFSKSGYEKFAQYLYSEGGSTAETDKAYCVYFEKPDKIEVRDLFADCTFSATALLQAVRERTGKETADIQLSQNSQLFLGEGKLVPHCAVKNLDKDLYANIMFD